MREAWPLPEEGGRKKEKRERSQNGPLALVLARSGPPQGFGFVPDLRRPTAQHEQEIGEPVQVDEAGLADRLLPRERGDDALRSATDGARLVEKPADPSSARQDE